MPSLRDQAAGLGHVGALPGPGDDVNRRLPLERVAGRSRRWALSLEVFRQGLGAPEIVSTPAGLEIGAWRIDSRWDQGRPMWIRYRPAERMPRVSAADLIAGRGLHSLRGRAVFIGVTALSAADDRLFTPLSDAMQVPGVEIHAHAYETLSAGDAPREASLSFSVFIAACLAAAAALLFSFLMGWPAYAGAAALLAAAHATPWFAFRAGWVLPAMAPAAAAWLAVLASASFQYFVVRRRMMNSEAATERYQQAFHFVAHEMRTPLTAIQGSSELISRYNLPEPKRKELGSMINAESKRLARMISTFLDVEKLGAGQMELRLADFPAADLVNVCLARAAPLAERKQIRLETDIEADTSIHADRELIEYALYNLITNAIKYSPAGSEVRVLARLENGAARLAVVDQGMGMEPSELKNLFRKFYRTRRAEASGEIGTGIGLSIVREIVTHHGGRVDVVSAPGQGSTFTLIVPSGEAAR
jgi:signal transduction histidine kinase